MKKIFFAFIILILVIKVNAQMNNDQSNEKEITQIMQSWRDGYNNGEAAKVAALYKDDAYYLTQHFITGIIHGRAAIQAYIQLGVDAKYHIDSIQPIFIECSDNLAYTITRYDANNNGQKAFGVNIVVLKKINSKWFIVAHEAAVPDLNTAIQRLDTLSSH
jgi:ketosteroid isomerase-like protein